MEAETRLSLLNKWLYNAGFVDPANGRVRNPFGLLRAEEIADPQLLDNLLILSETLSNTSGFEIYYPEPEEVAQRLLEPEHGIYLGLPGSGRTTLARYVHHQFASQSLGIYNDIDSAAEAAHEHLQSDKVGVFYLIVDQQVGCPVQELAYLFNELQRVSASGTRIWTKVFRPQTNSAAELMAQLSAPALHVQEIAWSARHLRGVLLQRLTWASTRDIKQGLNKYADDELLSHVKGDVNLALAQNVRTPRELLVEGRRLVTLALAGHSTPPAQPLTRDVWQSFVTSTPSSIGTIITSTDPLPSSSSAQPIPRSVTPRAADTSATPLLDRPIFSSSIPRRVFTIPMELGTQGRWVSVHYAEHVPTPSPRLEKLPYTETGFRYAPFWIIRRALERAYSGRSHYNDQEWSYLAYEWNLIDTYSQCVKENIGQEVGRELLNLLSCQEDFIQDLHASDFAADIRLRLKREDAFLACYPWELLAHNGESLLLKEVDLTRHLYGAKPYNADQPPLRVLYVAPRPVLSEDTWPGHNPNVTADYSQDDHRYIPNDPIRRLLADPDTATVRTFEELERRFTPDSGISAIHFDGHVAHGKYCKRCEKWVETVISCPTCSSPLEGSAHTVLAFERDSADRVVNPVRIDELAKLVRRTKPALVVLYACNSAISPDVNQGATGAAQQLLIEGARCVVGMQAPIYDVPVIRQCFMQTLYEQLSVTGSIATAMRAVRRELEDTGAWWMPVVYLRVGDDPNSPLFEIAPSRADG